MAKKKSRKKHQRKAVRMQPAPAKSTPAPLTAAEPPAAAEAAAGEYSYVLRDVRWILTLAVGFTLLQLILWYLFANTPLGGVVYGWFRL